VAFGNNIGARSELIDRLTGLRRTVQHRLIAYGLCAVLAGGIVSLLTIVTLDWLLDLPWLLRMIVAVFFLAGFVGATLHWIVKPLQAQLTLDEIAGKLEQHFPVLRDRLSSAVNFAQYDDPGSERMVRAVIEDTEQAVQSLPLGEALSLRPLIARFVWLIAGLTVLAGVLAAAPVWMQTGFYRYIHPMGEIEWPRTVSLLPITGDLTAAVGESVTVRMKVQRGLSDTLRAVVHLREPDGSTSRLTMRRESDVDLPESGDDESGVFSATIDSLSSNLTYWFSAGDDSTERHKHLIRVVRRPEVLEATAIIEPPHYASDPHVERQDSAGGAAPRIHTLGASPLHATIGSTVRVLVRASKPVRAGTEELPVGLRFDDDTQVPLFGTEDDKSRLEARFDLSHDVSFRIELRDEDGFENRGALVYSIRATPDQPPVVRMIEPQALTEVTPSGVVHVSSRVTDDFGVVAVTLHADRLSGEGAFDYNLSDSMSTQTTPSGVEAVVTHLWSLEPLKLQPGDMLAFFVEATDNFRSDEATGQVGRSSPMRLKIISDAEFEVRLRSDMAVLEARLRQLTLEQAELLDQTETVQANTPEGESLSESQRLSVSQAATEQTRLTRPVRELAQRFDQLAEQVQRNRTEDEARERITALAESLRQVAAGAMTRAGSSLQQSVETDQAPRQTDALAKATDEQRQAMEELQSVIGSLSQWGSFQGLVTRAQDLIDRQDALRTRTGELGRQMLGKPLESLTPEEVADLQRLARAQEQLADDADQWMQRMDEVRESSLENDPSAIEAIDAAKRAARSHDLAKRMESASDAVSENRTAAAMMEQKAAAQALRNMMAALRERDDRALAELRKRLTEAEEQIALLIQDQEALRDATDEAVTLDVEPTAYELLESEQRRLRRNAEVLADDLTVNERTAPVARTVQSAAQHMDEAATHLRSAATDTERRPDGNLARPALNAQDEALDALRDVYDRLQRMAQDAANEAFRRTLAQIQEELMAIRDAQFEVNEGIAALKSDVDRIGRLGRTQVREATRLSRSQGDVRALADKLLPELEKVVVYRWAMERVTGWMEQSASSLYDRRIDRELVLTTDRIVSEIDKLLTAIEQTQALPLNTDFMEAESGGPAGAGDAASHKAVPTVAELLVLKALQLDVNDRTKTLSDTVDPGDPTEVELENLKMLGEDQAEVRRLSDLVTRRARQP
jgi:hypothetical protein